MDKPHVTATFETTLEPAELLLQVTKIRQKVDSLTYHLWTLSSDDSIKAVEELKAAVQSLGDEIAAAMSVDNDG